MPIPLARASVALVIVVALAGTGARVAEGHAARAREARAAALDAARAATAAERAERDRAVAFYERRALEDPRSALDLGQLAGLYLQRARDLGDESDLQRAERAARRSAGMREAHNGRARALLASALLAQHRFVEAREVAERLHAHEPDVPAYRALLGETQLELGDYAGARRSFAGLRAHRGHLSIGPRLARWAEVAGRGSEALWLARALRDSALARRDVPREQRAWFHLRVGDLEARGGRYDDAARAYEDGLALAPDDHRLLVALARVQLARGNARQAVELGEQALAAGMPDPATLGVLSDAWRAIGDDARSDEYARAVELTAFASGAPMHRAWALFLIDRGRKVPDVLARAEAELRVRPDVYGWDLYAWALHRARRYPEALAAMRRALALGTEDVSLRAHARAICAAAGAGRDACPSS